MRLTESVESSGEGETFSAEKLVFPYGHVIYRRNRLIRNLIYIFNNCYYKVTSNINSTNYIS